MSNEIAVTYPGSATIYIIIREISTGYVWDGTAFAAWADGSIDDYDIALTSAGGDLYRGSIPSGITAATPLRITAYKQAGASPATSDLILTSWEENAPGTSSSYSNDSDEWTEQDYINAIKNIDTELASFVSTSGSGVDIKELDYEAKNSQRITLLLKMREIYQKKLDECPSADIFYVSDNVY